jgi:predicted SnoaL-like aldol condensation-catalyzing enzyme
MKRSVAAVAAILMLGAASVAHAETAAEKANKATVLKFWRECFDAQDVACAKKYIVPDYIQHNPNVPNGRQAFEDYFGKIWHGPLTGADLKVTRFDAVLADGDLVQLVAMRPRPEPGDPGKTYKSYWFDLFRVKDGKIVEHWDGALKPTPPK